MDVQFLDSTYAAGDDCVAVKSGTQVGGKPYVDSCGRPSRNIRVDNVSCTGRYASLTIGSELSGGVQNVSFTNVRIDTAVAGSAVRMKSACGRGAYARDILYENSEWRPRARLAVAMSPCCPPKPCCRSLCTHRSHCQKLADRSVGGPALPANPARRRIGCATIVARR